MSSAQSVAVVTGSGSGIGRALAVRLAAKGLRLALNDANPSALDETLRLVETEGGLAFGHAFDVSDREQVFGFAQQVRDRYGRADIVVNNAGVSLGPLLTEEISDKDFKWMIDVNLWGVIHGTRAFLPLLRESPRANLVNVSSSFGLIAIPLQSPYCTAKFAVRGFTDAVRLELLDTDICVSLVYPSQVKTNIVRNGRHKDDASRDEISQLYDDELAKSEPEDMANAIITGMERRHEHILYGRSAKLYWWAAKFIPQPLLKRVVRKLLAEFNENSRQSA
jgi:NAD(P)-dependent dehydrogenase (short-subunit alcohol dehydrogenase family)